MGTRITEVSQTNTLKRGNISTWNPLMKTWFQQGKDDPQRWEVKKVH